MATAREYIGTYYGDNKPVFNEDKMVCLRGQQERCPDTGRLHWQFYVKFKNSNRPKGAATLCGCEGAHMEPRKFNKKSGSMENYGLKSESSIEGTQFTYGNYENNQGERTDLKSVGRAILDGKELKEVAEMAPDVYIKYEKGLKSLQLVHLPERKWEMDVRIYWGAAGAGKTRSVYEEFKSVYPKPDNKWWDGYTGQECVLIDDFNPNDGWITFKNLLKLLDRYPLLVEYKGGTCNFCSKTIIFTCNDDPKTWWSHMGTRDKQAFSRRINSIKQFVTCHGS